MAGQQADGVRTIRVLDDRPSWASLYARVALPAVPGASLLPGVTAVRQVDGVPAMRLELPGTKPDGDRVRAYREVCGFPAHSTLPVTYPHVLAFPLQLSLMTDAAFPFAAMGTVHVSNRIVQRQPIGIDDELDLAVWVEDLRAHRRGHTVTVVSEVSVDGTVRWRDESVLLGRGSGEDDAPDVHDDLPAEAPPGPAAWSLPGSLGRRYAAVSGDRNPIHMFDLTAKAFGFRRHIVHGMWTKARCLAELDNRLPSAYVAEVAFRRPIELPGRVSFGARRRDASIDFGVRGASGGGATSHLLGRIRWTHTTDQLN